jgi:hypothetical protein
MDELVTKDVLAKHGITGLSDEGLGKLRSDVLGTAASHLALKAAEELSDEQVAELEAMPETGRNDRLLQLAGVADLAGWLKHEVDLIIIEISKNSVRSH